MKNVEHARKSFEQAARLMNVCEDRLAVDQSGTYLSVETHAAWLLWLKNQSGSIPNPGDDRNKHILEVYREHGSCRENDESDHISFANAVVDSFTIRPDE